MRALASLCAFMGVCVCVRVLVSLHSAPRRYQHMLSEVKHVQGKWANRSDLTLQEVGIGALFVGEVYAWFCVGEIVGRGFTLTGYKV